ncbi:immunoglobulin domain-containing protein [Aquimarina mytili]|uniref:Ig-like domain-containing protein n=1 Tax=Aquimarina mytili TaxID=874423 RepID=A0A937DAA7_9FLAO|nr:hypothetical protein [Aquimarina mytili]MBL0683368.1 hypothetical protein [Aquimarina mytili]
MLKTYIIIAFCFIISFTFAQSVNDYRSVGSGNWTNVSIWEVYNGTAWVAATTYPGEIAGTNDVSIEGGDSITVSSFIPNSFNSLTVGDGTGATDTLLVSGTSNLDTSRITIANGGFASWTANVSLFLPAGAAFVIEPGGSLDTTRPCSASKRLVIGSTIYATCNGGAGADFSFTDLNNGGGSLSVTPSSNSSICTSETLTLFANVSGTGSSTATFSWTGTGPGSYTFSSILENPTETGLTAGSYTYTVTVTSSDGSITNTGSTDVVVSDSPNAPVSNGNMIACTGATIPTLTVSVNAGETVDWYDAATGGTLLLSNNVSYTPTASGSYFAEARNIAAGCVSSTRTEIVLTIKTCTIITNSRITFRVKAN